MGRRRTRVITRTRTRTRLVRAGRRGARGLRRGLDVLRRGKINDIAAGVGGGILVGAAANRLSPNPTVGTVSALAGGWLFGGLWGLAGIAALRFFTSGLQFGGTNLSSTGLTGAARPALAAAAGGVQAI